MDNVMVTMKEITRNDYLEYVTTHDFITVGHQKIKLQKKWHINRFSPENFVPEYTTVWSFPDRGSWATHVGNYRGNWSPYVPRNLILKYTIKGDLVLDQMMGSGTTLVEARLLERDAIGVDINIGAVMLTRDRLNFEGFEKSNIKTYWGDARNLDKIPDNSVDLIATHPPYANIINYSRNINFQGDLSNLPLPKYLMEMGKVAYEAFRVLKPGKICAILIGDTRKYKHYIPISHYILDVFLKVGFILKEDIIKLQWNTKSGREKWRGKNYDFYLINHEHIFIFKKPKDDLEYQKLKFSTGKL